MEQEHTTNSHKAGIQKFLQTKNLLLVIAVAVLGVTTVTAYTLSQQKTELTTQANTSLSFPVVEDSWVDESNTKKGRGSDNQLKVDTDKIAYLKFDLGSLQSQPVQKATLRLYILNGSNTAQNIEEVTSSNWTESALNYANKPDIGDSLASIANTEKNTWKDVDITAFVNNNKGKIVSLAISALPDDKNNFYIASKETANAPVIMIETTNAGGVVATTMVTQPQSSVLTQAPTAVQPSRIPTSVAATAAPTIGSVITVPPTVVPTYSGGARNINVTNGTELQSALDNAQPGDAITLANGTYTAKGTSVMVGKQNASAKFRISKSGTAGAPITIQGTRNAIINGGGTGGDYGLHLFKANHIVIKGITIAQSKKGLMVDGGNNNLIENVEVKETGQEGIHLRSFSSDNKIINSSVHHTGQNKTGAITDQYGEGIYVGTANSNWGTYTDGKVDTSDRNEIINNVISYTGGEGIDLKEGTSNGKVIGNSFDNAGIAGGFADSWMDVKGNGWIISGNKGVNARKDGYQVHGVWAGWGNNNTFSNNSAGNVKDYGFWVQNNVTGNKIMCNNTAQGAPAGLANVPCSN